MRKFSAALFLSAFGGATAACAASEPAHAGAWRLDPALCPDLVEDYLDRREDRRDRRENRRDERYDFGPLDRDEDRIDRREDRRDRRENRRDERVTVCPASAWVWDGPVRYRSVRPAAAAVYYDRRDDAYYRLGPKDVRVRIVVR